LSKQATQVFVIPPQMFLKQNQLPNLLQKIKQTLDRPYVVKFTAAGVLDDGILLQQTWDRALNM
jgi:hypothetical protein